jgi:hypothetical protein
MTNIGITVEPDDEVAYQNASYTSEVKHQLLLDSGSSINSACNPTYVKNIRKSNNKLHLHTNNATSIADHKADMGNTKVWYDEKGLMNMHSLADLAKQHRHVTYDLDVELVFNVHLPTGVVKIPETPDGVYALDLRQPGALQKQ